MIPLRPLARFARSASGPGADSGPRCELCSAEIGAGHRHVVDLERRTLCCACPACALLFVSPEAAGGRYRTVPDRVLVDPDLGLDRERWSATDIPVGLAFVFFASPLDRWVAFYPSPAGAVEAELDPDAWLQTLGASRLAAELEPDVEALLVYARRGGGSPDCLLVPIDACYRLVAELRRHWEGFGGGGAVAQAIEASIAELRARSRPLPPKPGEKR